MPSKRTRQSVALILVSALLLTGLSTAVGGSGESVALPHNAPEHHDGNVTVLRGHGELVESMNDNGDLRRSRARGRVRAASHLVPGDLLVLQFRSEQVNESFSATDGPTVTDRFFGMVETTAVNLSVEGRNHGTSQVPAELRLNQSNVAVLYDPSNATFSLLVDTHNVSLIDRNDGDPLQRDLDHLEFEAVVRTPTDDGTRRTLVGSAEFRPAGVTVRTPTPDVSLQSTPATVSHNATKFTVNASTTLLPGSNLTVRAVTPDGTILAEQRVQTRGSNGTNVQSDSSGFRTTLSVGPLDTKGAFDLIISQSEPIVERRIVVGTPPQMWNTSAELVTTGEHEGEVAVHSALRLPANGFLLVYVDGEPITKPVPEDIRTRQTMYVNRSAIDPDNGKVYVLAFWDTDADGIFEKSDRLFRTGVDVGASKEDSDLDTNVPVSGWSKATPTTSPSSSPSSPMATNSTTSTPASTSNTANGFGALLAIVSIVSSGLVRAWR